MSTNYTTQIDENECIGDSLDTINSNFASLDTTCATLSSTFTAAYTCERNDIGGANQVLSFGANATTHNGIRMPFNGIMIAASLQGHLIVGNISVEPYLNAIRQPVYRLTYIGSNTSGGQHIYYPVPLQFNAGDALGWIQAAVPSGGRFNVNFLVKYFI
jgi:hypothetical protein